MTILPHHSTSKEKQSNQTSKMVVLHFIGAGRSGSTLLNIILDTQPQIISVGELGFFAKGWLSGAYCSCQKTLPHCSFWSYVHEEWLRRTGMTTVADYVQLQKRWERYRQLPILLAGIGKKTIGYKQYQRYTCQLYEIISEADEAAIVADSSKKPGRVYLLSQIQGIDLRVVHLIRDARGYAWSKQKELNKNGTTGVDNHTKPFPVWRSTMRWITMNLLAYLISHKVGNNILVKYEELISQPQEVFDRIGTFLELNLSSLASSISSGQPFHGRHIQAGNRLRMQTKITLRKEQSWPAKMPENQKTRIKLLSGWLMKWYGYD